jgi:hypothetical protein
MNLVFVLVVTVLLGAHLMQCAPPNLQKLGAYNYQTDESSPLWFGGRIVIMETMSSANPTRVYDCGCYFEVRDLLTHNVIVSLEQTCNHAFGAATVQPDEHGKETLYIFGTRWIRFDNKSPDLRTKKGLGWTGPCSLGNCSVDVFWSNDPTLQMWNMSTAYNFPTGMIIYNVDVGPVNPDSLKKYNPTLPEHRWVMAIEHDSEVSTFLLNNGTTLTSGKWFAYTPPTSLAMSSSPGYALSVGGTVYPSACPSVRYSADTGYYYVLTGGYWVYIMRSKDLKTWEAGIYDDGVILKPDNTNDCKQISNSWSNWSPSKNGLILLGPNCTQWDKNSDDVDLTEIILSDKSVGTLLMWDASDQVAIGFSELALFHGNMEEYLASNFQ